MAKKYGFTLVELLVVISIISILAGLGMVSFSAAQVRARDGQRKADFKTVQQALELYYTSQSPPVYPTTSQKLSALSPNYLKVIPQDPRSPNYQYSYNSPGVGTDGSTYKLVACLENANDSQKDATLNGFCKGKAASYTVENP